MAGYGDRLGYYLQTLDKQVTEQRKFELYEFLHYYPPVRFMWLHVHIFWKNYYVIIYVYIYYKNLATGAVGWGSSIRLLMSCTFNKQICSIKFLVLYYKHVGETWSFLSLKIWHVTYTQNMYTIWYAHHYNICIISDISFNGFLTWIMYTNTW